MYLVVSWFTFFFLFCAQVEILRKVPSNFKPNDGVISSMKLLGDAFRDYEKRKGNLKKKKGWISNMIQDEISNEFPAPFSALNNGVHGRYISFSLFFPWTSYYIAWIFLAKKKGILLFN